ncbi:hypothetical protein N0V90_006729 [Kalmusia sp. IMI 367209]|nr:hypothetical protein N0V90_006729 [Kalmusia sp. IMI 367209]
MPEGSRFKLPLRSKAKRGVGSSSSRTSSASAPSHHASSLSTTSSAIPTTPRVRAFTSQSNHAGVPQSSSSARSLEHRPVSEPEDDTLNEVVMAVDLQQKDTVGCCYYVAWSEKLYFMEDVKLGGIAVIDALRVYIDPTVVLVSTKIDDAVIDTFENLAEDRFSLPFLLEVRPPSEFSFDAAKSKLASLSFEDNDPLHINFVVPGDLNPLGEESMENARGRQGRLLRLAGLIDLDSRITVLIFRSISTINIDSVQIGCAGALLSYLQRRRTAAYLPGDQAAHMMFRTSSLEMFSLQNTM